MCDKLEAVSILYEMYIYVNKYILYVRNIYLHMIIKQVTCTVTSVWM